MPVYVAYRKSPVLGPAASWVRDALLETAVLVPDRAGVPTMPALSNAGRATA